MRKRDKNIDGSYEHIHVKAEQMMGTWASGSFENDTALDWLAELYERNDPAVVSAALSRMMEPPEPYSNVGVEQRAVAAADIVACWLGHPPPEPKRAGLGEWVRKHFAFTPELVRLAQHVVVQIKSQSELRVAWTDHSGSVSTKWLDSITDLERRLNTHAPNGA